MVGTFLDEGNGTLHWLNVKNSYKTHLRNELRKEEFSLRRLKWRQIWYNGHIRNADQMSKAARIIRQLQSNIRRVWTLVTTPKLALSEAALTESRNLAIEQNLTIYVNVSLNSA